MRDARRLRGRGAGKLVKRYRAANVGASRRYALRPQGVRRGDYRVAIDVRAGTAHVTRTLTSRRL